MNTRKKSIQDIIFFLVILIIFSIAAFTRDLINLDEVWNFNFGKAIADGKLPYKDISMIIPPLYSLITGFSLFLFGKELLVVRVLSVITLGIVFYITMRIFKLLDIRKSLSYFFILITSVVLFNYFYFNYNSMILIISLIILYLELKNNLKNELLLQNTKNDILIGILCGLAIATKQSTGLYITFFTLIYKILAVKSKQDCKSYFSILIKRCAGVSLPVLILCLYLTVNNIWKDFFEYTVFGIKYFNNAYPYYLLFFQGSMIIRILCIILPVFLAICLFKLRKDIIIFSSLGICIANTLILFPIADECHFVFGSYISFLLLIYVINKYVSFNKLFTAMAYLNTLLIIMLSALTILNSYSSYTKKEMSLCRLNHFNNIPISKAMKDVVYPLVDFIKFQDKQVIILYSDAAFYNTPLDIYHKNFDMFLRGNLGLLEEHPESILMDDTIYLILKNKYPSNWQTPTNLVDYVKEHTERIGEISIYDIYTSK